MSPHAKKGHAAKAAPMGRGAVSIACAAMQPESLAEPGAPGAKRAGSTETRHFASVMMFCAELERGFRWE